MRRLHHDEQGLAGTVLVIVIAWALAAVLMLTGTLVAAQQIDDLVADITTSVSAIDDDTASVALAEETTRISGDILSAAQPLEEQLDQVLGSVASIDTSVVSILDTAGSIDSSVNSIRASASDIDSSVRSINSRLDGTFAHVRSIRQGIEDINVRVDTIIGLVRGIESDTDDVRHVFRRGDNYPVDAGIRGHAESIDCSGLTGLATGGGEQC